MLHFPVHGEAGLKPSGLGYRMRSALLTGTPSHIPKELDARTGG